jgi:Peptidase MA superfamily
MPSARPRALGALAALACALVAASGGWSERSSSHFQLFESVGFARYSGPEGSREFERAVLATLENAHERVRDQLKVEPRNRVKVYVYAPDVFDAEYASRFGFRAAGFWDGAIHVRGGQRFDARLVSTLHHEYTHSALESVAPRDLWPAWLNEGLAEYFERQALGQSHLTAQEDARLRDAVATGEWIPLGELSGPTLAGLGQAQAELAYLESYAAVELMFRRAGQSRVQSLVREVGRTHSPERALESTLRVDLAGLEAQLTAELR